MIVRQPVTADRSTTICDAATMMERQGVGALLVVEDDRLVGIVTDRDIVLRGVARNVPGDSRIDALMTTEVLTMPSGADVERAYDFFRDHAVRRLPIVEGRRLVGMLSLDDLLIRSEYQIAELTHPVHDEMYDPHHEPQPPVSTRAPRAGTQERSLRRQSLRARAGDTLVVHHHSLGMQDRVGEIFEVRSPVGDPPFAVKWSDTGQVAFLYPGPDAEIHHTSHAEPAGNSSG
ncbi:MAG: CBS domain-containing protein [Frankia sp.]